MHKHLLTAGIIALGLTSNDARAWTWPDEPEMRVWNTDKVEWAQEVLLKAFGEQWDSQTLQSTFAPPPREAWCVEAPAPTTADCDELDFRVRLYLRDELLELEPGQPLPVGLPTMPPECASICN